MQTCLRPESVKSQHKELKLLLSADIWFGLEPELIQTDVSVLLVLSLKSHFLSCVPPLPPQLESSGLDSGVTWRRVWITKFVTSWSISRAGPAGNREAGSRPPRWEHDAAGSWWACDRKYTVKQILSNVFQTLPNLLILTMSEAWNEMKRKHETFRHCESVTFTYTKCNNIKIILFQIWKSCDSKSAVEFEQLNQQFVSTFMKMWRLRILAHTVAVKCFEMCLFFSCVCDCQSFRLLEPVRPSVTWQQRAFWLVGRDRLWAEKTKETMLHEEEAEALQYQSADRGSFVLLK